MDSQRNQILARQWVTAQSVIAGYLHAQLGDFQQVEEVLQSTAAAAVRKVDEYDPERPFLPWVMGIAHYEVLMFRRRLARDRCVFDNEVVERLTSRYQTMAPQLRAMEQSLAECLDQLPARSRQVVDLRYREGLKPRQIAEHLNHSGDAVRSLLKRALQLLRDCLVNRDSITEGGAE
ncbi:sigma-70 family RNA polymerase sigma factor [Planctomycetales bacterium ZRK34]|nr:sigma-70 family RNA polymerase sigma factor [Planctomycetales bacterium ZRK34]